MKNKSGITFMELVVTVILVGIFASFGINGYNKAKTNARKKELKTNMLAIKAGQNIFKAKKGYYFPNSGTANVSSININLNLKIFETSNITYSCTRTASATTFSCKGVLSGVTTCTLTQASDVPSST